MNLLEVLNFGFEELLEQSFDPEFESMVFLEEATGKTKEEILVNNEQIMEYDFLKFKNYLHRRSKGEPWQYIVGNTNFIGLEIFSEKGVFIPRSETELMTVHAISKLRNFKNPLVLEIGCGTGAISISIASSIKKARIIATDISKKAIRLSKKNIDRHNLKERISVVNADLLECFGNLKKFDMIISNPPYIPDKGLDEVDDLVKKEPVLALNGGVGGVRIINKILKYSARILKRGGLIFIEIDSLNVPYIVIPKDLTCQYEKDQYNRVRFLYGVKV